jgi:uncharacterized membrane protein YraQ (UPF0718 family)
MLGCLRHRYLTGAYFLISEQFVDIPSLMVSVSVLFLTLTHARRVASLTAVVLLAPNSSWFRERSCTLLPPRLQ